MSSVLRRYGSFPDVSTANGLIMAEAAFPHCARGAPVSTASLTGLPMPARVGRASRSRKMAAGRLS
jgi:hypothetical protein